MSAQKHGVGATIVEWLPIKWLLTCSCGEYWTGPTYESAEDDWRRHVYAVNGVAPRPMGDKTARWEAGA